MTTVHPSLPDLKQLYLPLLVCSMERSDIMRDDVLYRTIRRRAHGRRTPLPYYILCLDMLRLCRIILLYRVDLVLPAQF